MNLLQTIRNWVTPLTNQDKQTIWKMFGSFDANKFALDHTSLIENSYEKNVDVYAVIKKIVDVTKSVDWIVEEKKGNEWIKMEQSTIHDIIASPNATKGYTWNDIEEQVLVYLLVTGNAYLHGESQFNSSIIEELDVLPSDAVCIESNRDFFMPTMKYKFTIDSKVYNIEKEKVAHVKFFNPKFATVQESLYGLSPIQTAALVVQTGNARWEADAAMIQNRGIYGIITDKSQYPLTPEEAVRIQENFNQQSLGTRKQGTVKVSNKDLGFIQMAMSSTDLQLLEKGVVNLRAICNLFGLDSSLFNDPENKTYSNRTEAEKSMFTNAVMPISDKLAETFTRFIAWNHYPNKNVRMRQDFSSIHVLQENFKEKADVYVALRNAGIVTPNEAARALNLPVSEDANADELLVLNSTVLLETLGGKKDSESIQLEILRGLSPLTANKIIESLDTNEIRALLGLPAKAIEPPQTPPANG